MDATHDLTDRAAIITVNDEVGSHPAVAYVPMETYADGSPIAAQMAAVAATFPIVADQTNAANAQFMPNRRSEVLRDVVARTLTPPFQAATTATIAEAASIDAAHALSMNYRAGDPALRPMTINRFAAMSQAEQVDFAQNASVERTSAIVAAGRDHFPDMDDTIWQIVERRHMVQSHIRMTGLQADFQRKPSAADPTAHGPDVAAVERAATEALQRHEARRDVVDAANASLRSIIAAVALATDLSHDDAYALLTGKRGAA